MVAGSDIDEQGSDNLLVFGRRGEVDWLVYVVRGRMIALGRASGLLLHVTSLPSAYGVS